MSQTRLRQEHRQQQTLTPRLQQAVRLLQLSSLDFALEVNRALESNPFLEQDEATGDSDAANRVPAAEAARDALAGAPVALTDAPQITVIDSAPDPRADGEWESSAWAQYGSPGSKRSNGSDVDVDFAELASVDESLRDHLKSQAQLLPVSERDRILVAMVIEALDDDGYLRISMEELKGLAGVDPEPDLDELLVALRLVQSLEPAGVAARDLKECLLLQLREFQNGGRTPVHTLATRIVEDLLDRVAGRDVAGIARALKATPIEVENALDCIRHLVPRPGWRYGAPDTRFIVPDIIVRKVRDEWTVMLNPDIVPRVRLNRMYADLFRSNRDSSHADLAAQLQEARWTVRNVEQRFSTILRVGQAIVKRQRNFLDYGELAMKPLGLREIAEELELHESTVSRVTNNKYMATPLGVFELKFFFSRALATSSGGSCSTTAIRGAIKEMIEEEDASNPLSDAHIARLLARQGLKVARRTVTKYRQMMKVPPYEARRRERRSNTAR
jgi:RNA polymerase sigma-54 factor